LNERRKLLENGERIASALQRAHESLAGDDIAVTGMLGDASVALAGIAEIAEPFAELARQASALQSEAGDLAGRLARALEATEFDPAELETINARLDTLDRLKRKYGGTLEAVLGRGTAAREAAESFEGRDRRVAELATKVAAAARELGAAAQTLTALRKLAAKKLQAAVSNELGEIALGSARFEIGFEPLERVGPSGAERVELLFAANPGEPVRALSKVASGGELSRVLLALVVSLAGVRADASALVFDEIDAGVGGATATAVGGRIGRLAQNAQVVCVTHLAQLATWADRHYVLDKIEGDGETTIEVREIEKRSEREAELARMLSGETHEAALAHARALLEARA
jgi:DNA repair protein RecN (Recombination protein N)